MPLTSLDGLLKFEVFTGEMFGRGTPHDPAMLNQTMEETVGIIHLERQQPNKIEWELANGWHRRPMGWPEEYYDLSLLVKKYVNEKFFGSESGPHRRNGTYGTYMFGTEVRVDRCYGHIKLEFWRPDKESVVAETGIAAKIHTFILLYRTDKHGQNCVACRSKPFEAQIARAERCRLARQAAEQQRQDVADQQAQRELEVAQGLNERERLLRQRELAVEQRERELERQERDIVHAAPYPVGEDRKPVIPEVQDSGSESRLEGRLAKVEQELASLRSMVRKRESRSPSPSEPSKPRKRPRRSNGAL